MAKILVTGASGFIGAHLVAALRARGDDVLCLVRRTSNVEHLQPFKPHLIYGDVTDYDSLTAATTGVDVVYHLAGRTVALHSKQFYEVNRRGTALVAKACARQTSPPILIYVSSLAAAGPAIGGRPRVESDVAAPVSHYGRSKRAGERMVEKYAGRLPVTIVRPPIVLGQFDRMGLPLFRSVLRTGIHLTPGFRTQRFSLIHAADLASLLILAAERGHRLPPNGSGADVGTGYYFAACEQNPTYSDLGQLIAESMGQRVLVIPTAMPVVRIVAVAGETIGQLRHKPLIMNLDKFREIRAGSWTCSAQAAREQLGFNVAAPLVERLHQTAEWYQQYGWL